MIAQRKPNLDKGFEELHPATPDTAWKAAFLPLRASNRCNQDRSKPRQRWFLPTFGTAGRALEGPLDGVAADFGGLLHVAGAFAPL
jgi:hypothetical protein